VLERCSTKPAPRLRQRLRFPVGNADIDNTAICEPAIGQECVEHHDLIVGEVLGTPLKARSDRSSSAGSKPPGDE
jgi:hypothetical protein